MAEQEFHSSDHKALQGIVEDFLSKTAGPGASTCFCVASPVLAGRAHVTDLPWGLEETVRCNALELQRVRWLNDQQAIAHTLPHLLPEETAVIHKGQAIKHAPIAVLAPGTGLGESYIIWSGRHYVACQSEGEHADLGPTGDGERRGLSGWQHAPVKGGVEAGHLRKHRMSLPERLDQFNLARKMIGIVGDHAVQLAEQCRRDNLRLCVLQPRNTRWPIPRVVSRSDCSSSQSLRKVTAEE